MLKIKLEDSESSKYVKIYRDFLSFYQTLIVPNVLFMDMITDFIFVFNEEIFEESKILKVFALLFVILPIILNIRYMFQGLNKSIWWADYKTNSKKHQKHSTLESIIMEKLFWTLDKNENITKFLGYPLILFLKISNLILLFKLNFL